MVIHGGVKENLLDFSISINPYIPAWSRAVFLKFPKTVCRYNYVEWIEDAFCNIYGTDAVVLAGITEALQILSFTLIDNASVVIPSPCYSEYERISSFKAKKIVKIPPIKGEMDLSSAFDTAKNLRKNGEKTVLIFANPSNPTGSYFRGITEDIEELISIGIIVIIDEAFIDFVKNSDKCINTGAIIMKSFTKSYGMPGIRIGYIKSKQFGKLFKAHRMPWAVGTSGYLFLEQILTDKGKFLTQSLHKIWNEYRRFEEIGLKTDCNFGCIKVSSANDAEKKLDRFGIHVRNCSSFGFYDKIRISIKTPEENDMLFDALRKASIL